MSDSIKATAARPEGQARMAFVDNIRWTVIAMVVLMHACVTYSGIGSWYYNEAAIRDLPSQLGFLAYQSFSQAFFMGLLFFIAAIFIPKAYDRKGFARFALDKIVRLGIPTLVYMLAIHPATILIHEAGTGGLVDAASFLRWYGAYVASGDFVAGSGPLWFAFALLAFSLAYGASRLALDALRSPATRAAAAARRERAPAVPSLRSVNRGVALLIAGISLGTFLVRLVQPLGESVLNMQLCYFVQYVALFVLGLRAARSGLLQSLPRQAGKLWLRLALAAGVPAWLLLLGLGGATSGNVDAYGGGWTWQAAGLAAWESFFGVAFGLGLLVLFREKANSRGRAAGILADTSFGVYVFHAPILVASCLLIRDLAMYPVAKAALAAAIAWAASLAFAALVRRAPGLGKIFS